MKIMIFSLLFGLFSFLASVKSSSQKADTVQHQDSSVTVLKRMVRQKDAEKNQKFDSLKTAIEESPQRIIQGINTVKAINNETYKNLKEVIEAKEAAKTVIDCTGADTENYFFPPVLPSPATVQPDTLFNHTPKTEQIKRKKWSFWPFKK